MPRHWANQSGLRSVAAMIQVVHNRADGCLVCTVKYLMMLTLLVAVVKRVRLEVVQVDLIYVFTAWAAPTCVL